MYAWSFSGNISRIPCIFLLIFYILYILVQSISIKQAKGPSELFFVQSLESANLMLVLVTMMTLFQVNSWYITFLFLLVLTCAFYERLQQYLTNKLIIPKVNLSYDGPAIFIVIELISIIVGPGVWSSDSFSIGTVFTIILIVFTVFAIVFKYFLK